MPQDPNELFPDADIVEDQSVTVESDLVTKKREKARVRKQESRTLKKLRDASSFGLDERKREIERNDKWIQNQMNEEQALIQSAENSQDVLMARYAERFGVKSELTMERMDEIGFALLDNYACIEDAADILSMDAAVLRWLISKNWELQTYWRLAVDTVKNLVDKNVIRALREKEPWATRMVFNKMYAGRDKGGFNIAELGTMGYKDQVGVDNASETEDIMKAKNISVTFNFVDDKAIGSEVDLDRQESDFIEAEYEDVEEQ